LSGSRILLLEPSAHARALSATVLERAGHRVVSSGDGHDALRRFFEHRPDLVIVELDVPGLDGFTVIARIRELSDVPVMVVTQCSGELETVRALRAGADDYVVKPFRNAELVARTEAVLRRAGGDSLPDVVDDGLVRIDFARRSVAVAGRAVRLTPLEFKLLATMVRHPGQVMSSHQLLELVWRDPGAGNGDEVRQYIGYLRRKLRTVSDAAPIETVRGFGYRYEPPVALRAA
jgi:DNA-binding response OmpR family regulator